MKRFTEKDKYCDVNIIGVNSARLYEELDYDEDLTLTIALNKLATLEDIEEELGISLIKLFKALKNGIYNFNSGYIEHDMIANIKHWPEGWGLVTCDSNLGVLLSDYGNTWALTKEELLKK